MFSPYYAAARRRGAGDPEHYCSVNVALYNPNGKRWAMTERGRGLLGRTEDSLRIGPSALGWDGTSLTIEIDELAVPHLSRIRGVVRVTPKVLFPREFALDAASRHYWTPLGALSSVSVEMEQPSLRWSGSGYFDINAGAEPLETGFKFWTWSRADVAGGTAILYDVVRRDGGEHGLALRLSDHGQISGFEPPPVAELSRPLWRMPRRTRSGRPPRVIRTLEDAPFYSRSVISASLLGQDVTAMHESLSLDRFDRRWVQALLPFRMPRIAG